MARRDGDGVRADLVGGVAVGGDAVGADEHDVDLAAAHQARGHAVGEDRDRDARPGRVPTR